MATVVMVLQFTSVLNQHIIYLKCTQLRASWISIKLGRKKIPRGQLQSLKRSASFFWAWGSGQLHRQSWSWSCILHTAKQGSNLAWVCPAGQQQNYQHFPLDTALGCIVEAWMSFCRSVLGVQISTDKFHNYNLLCYNLDFRFVSHLVGIDKEMLEVGVTQKRLFTRGFFPSTFCKEKVLTT